MHAQIIYFVTISLLYLFSFLFFSFFFSSILFFLYSFTVSSQGTNVDEAKVMIGSSGMKILPVDNLDEAARLAVKLSNIIGIARDAKVDVQFEIPL